MRIYFPGRKVSSNSKSGSPKETPWRSEVNSLEKTGTTLADLSIPAISVSHFSKKYRGVLAVEDVSFQVLPGQVVGLIGPNGAGKSTLLNCLLGLLPPTSGTLHIFGSPLFDLKEPSSLVGVVRIPDGLDEKLKVKQLLTLAAIASGSNLARVDEVMKLCGISELTKSCVSKISTGQRQRVSIALAFLPEPPLLICDEPQNGLDTEGVIWFRDLIKAHAKNGGSVLLATHFLGEIEKMADDLIVLCKSVKFKGTAREMTLGDTLSLEDRYMLLTEETSR